MSIFNLVGSALKQGESLITSQPLSVERVTPEAIGGSLAQQFVSGFVDAYQSPQQVSPQQPQQLSDGQPHATPPKPKKGFFGKLLGGLKKVGMSFLNNLKKMAQPLIQAAMAIANPTLLIPMLMSKIPFLRKSAS